MDPIEKRELKRKAWMRLAAQKRRAGILRGRVVVMSLICFVVLWGVVFAQMATGNDPVLGGKKTASTRSVAVAKREVETTEPRELEPRHKRHQNSGGDGIEAEAEAEEPVTAEVEEAGSTQVEAEEAEALQIEAEEAEAVEFEEPLVTSQS